jgi:Uma2 family endonuclease
MEITEKVLSEYEIQRGKPMPSKNHSIIQKRLIVSLSNNYDEKYEIFSEVSLELSDWESTPDLAIFPKMKINFLEDEVRLTETPLCVIEILSPTQALSDLTSKANKYFKNGVKSCWLVLPSLRNIYVFSTITDYQIFSVNTILNDAALDIQIPLNEIFK